MTTPTTRGAAPRKPSGEQELAVVRAQSLSRIPWLVHGFSTRRGGSSTCYEGRTLNLGFTEEDSRECVEENRRRFLAAIGASARRKPWPLAVNRQIHSDIIHVLRGPVLPNLPLPNQDAPPQPGDGLITDRPGIAVAILTADCMPVLLADRQRRVVGAFHAGWRGTVQRIAEKGVGAMRREFGSRPQDIHAAIGPGIQKCCYGVGGDVMSKFESQFAYAAELFHALQQSDPVREKYPLLFLNVRAPGHGDPGTRLHLDLSEANRRQIIDAGVPEDQITVCGECTACDTRKFFSHRAEDGRTGRMMNAVGIVP